MSLVTSNTSSVSFPDISTGLSSAQWARGTRPLAIRRLRAVVLLGGAVRRTRFLDGIARPTTMLPVGPDKRLIDLWVESVEAASEEFALDGLQCRVVLGRKVHPSMVLPASEVIDFRVEHDPTDFRGTGGLVADVAAGFDDDDFLLVAPGSIAPPADLIGSLRAAARIGTDLSILIGACGRPLDLFLIRCGSLDSIPSIGFIDLKEQGIPLVAREHTVGVARTATFVRPSARTAPGYLELLRSMNSDASVPNQAFSERWSKAFTVVEAGAEVDPTACLHDTVVLAGGRVGAGATVARSIICPGGRVRPRESVIRKIVTATGIFEVPEK